MVAWFSHFRVQIHHSAKSVSVMGKTWVQLGSGPMPLHYANCSKTGLDLKAPVSRDDPALVPEGTVLARRHQEDLLPTESQLPAGMRLGEGPRPPPCLPPLMGPTLCFQGEGQMQGAQWGLEYRRRWKEGSRPRLGFSFLWDRFCHMQIPPTPAVCPEVWAQGFGSGARTGGAGCRKEPKRTRVLSRVDLDTGASTLWPVCSPGRL